MPKTGPDKDKIKKIRKVLKQNPKGLWIREIARKAEISKSTVHKYINEYMKNELEDVIKVKGLSLRLVRLKR
ncbi:MAG: HTH domain-containing protein [Nanoarchaeota archaeon]